MPKKGSDFPITINVKIDPETVATLKAIGFYRGDGGQYAAPVRDFIRQGIDRWVSDLTPAQRRRYDEIKTNVTSAEAFRKIDQ